MAKEQILKLLLWLLAAPQILLSLLLEILGSRRLRAELALCKKLAQTHGRHVPQQFREALILAEDHRNGLHPGIDAIAMLRAAWVWIATGNAQGASTIEQQFVRVVSGRYERTLFRKAREQVMALMLARRVSKASIASAYLSVAFYGSGCVGVEALRRRCGTNLDGASFRDALWMVSMLKYPCPSFPSAKWRSRLEARCRYLLARASGTANISLQRRVPIKCTRPTVI